MSKITLNNVGSLVDATTAQATINANNAVIQTAFDNTLSRDGTPPNTMTASLDMNSNRVLNLPKPLLAGEPARLSDLTATPYGVLGTMSVQNANAVTITGGTINGVTGTAAGFNAGTVTTNANLTGVVTSIGNATSLGSFTSAALKTALTDETGSGAVVFATSPALTTPSLGVATAITVNGAALDNLAWSTYTPTVTSQVGTITAYTATGRYKQIGKTVFLETDVVITTVGTAAGVMLVTVPVTAAAFRYAGISFDYGATNKSGAGYINGGTTPTFFTTADATGTTFFGANAKIASSFTYEVP